MTKLRVPRPVVSEERKTEGSIENEIDEDGYCSMLVYWQQEWARDGKFDSFWRHFELSERWRREHQEVKQKLNKHFINSTQFEGKRPKLDMRWVVVKEEIQGGPSREVEEEEEESMEMDEEMKEFFRTTMAHRAEREAMRKAEKKEDEKSKGSHWIRINNEEYIPADKIGVEGIQSRTLNAPNEPAALEEKRKEARELYGDKWERIMSMECEMELKFRRIFDEKQPPMWPVIPFRL